MIVHNLYLVRPLIGPPKDYTPLVVDPDGVKTRQIAPEGFKTVARRNGEVAEPARLVDLDEFSQRHAGYCRQTAIVPSPEQLLCVPVCEGLDQSGCPLAPLLITSQVTRWKSSRSFGTCDAAGSTDSRLPSRRHRRCAGIGAGNRRRVRLRLSSMRVSSVMAPLWSSDQLDRPRITPINSLKLLSWVWQGS